MNNQQLSETFSDLSTPLIADACLSLEIPLRLAPSGIRPLLAHSHIAGRVLRVRHYGSVDIFIKRWETQNRMISSLSTMLDDWTKAASEI